MTDFAETVQYTSLPLGTSASPLVNPPAAEAVPRSWQLARTLSRAWNARSEKAGSCRVVLEGPLVEGKLWGRDGHWGFEWRPDQTGEDPLRGTRNGGSWWFPVHVVRDSEEPPPDDALPGGWRKLKEVVDRAEREMHGRLPQWPDPSRVMPTMRMLSTVLEACFDKIRTAHSHVSVTDTLTLRDHGIDFEVPGLGPVVTFDLLPLGLAPWGRAPPGGADERLRR